MYKILIEYLSHEVHLDLALLLIEREAYRMELSYIFSIEYLLFIHVCIKTHKPSFFISKWTQAKFFLYPNGDTKTDRQCDNVCLPEFLRLYLHNVFIEGAQSPL
jgi:hypothetical protein